MPGRVSLSIALCALFVSSTLLRAESAPETTRTPLPNPDRTKVTRPADPPSELVAGNLAKS
jgi:hypothetical protein